MTTTILTPYDSGLESSRSGAGSWQIPWQPEPVDDITFHHQTVRGFASSLVYRRYTGSPEPPTPGTGGYYHSRWWVEFDLSALPAGEEATAAEVSVTMSVGSAHTLDSPAMDLYYVPRVRDPAVNIDSGCSQRDWELSDASFIGSVANPYVSGTHVISVSPGLLGTGFCAIVFLLDQASAPTGDTTNYDETNISVTASTPTLTVTTAVPAAAPPLASAGLAGEVTGDCQSLTLIELEQCLRAKLHRLRYATWTVDVELHASIFAELVEGDEFPYLSLLRDVRPTYRICRVLSRSYDGATGRCTARLQFLRHPEGAGRAPIMDAERPLAAPNTNLVSDPIGLLAAHSQALVKLALS